MSLAGKISIEFGIHATATKWFNLYTATLHDVQKLTDRIHETKLHHGEDWHHNESIKQWTYIIDGKVTTCLESIKSIDEANKTITFKLFGGDIDDKYKVFYITLQAIDKGRRSAILKWSIEYERIGEEIHPPYGYLEFLHTACREIDVHLKA